MPAKRSKAAALVANPPNNPDYAIALRINEIMQLDAEFCAKVRDVKMPLHDLESAYHACLRKILDLTCEIFSIYTRAECAVSIKALNYHPTEIGYINHDGATREFDLPYVYTFGRDKTSQVRRLKLCQDPALAIYDFRKNTGLSEAFDSGYWYSNDIAALGERYVSVNQAWPEYYNAAAILPLCLVAEKSRMAPLGFLCVDNKTGEFDDMTCRQYLDIISKVVYPSLRMTSSKCAIEGTSDAWEIADRNDG